MATPPEEVMTQPHAKDVAFIYGKLNGVDGAEVTMCAGGATTLVFRCEKSEF